MVHEPGVSTLQLRKIFPIALAAVSAFAALSIWAFASPQDLHLMMIFIYQQFGVLMAKSKDFVILKCQVMDTEKPQLHFLLPLFVLLLIQKLALLVRQDNLIGTTKN